MTGEQSEIADVLRAYPADCQPHACEPLGAAGGFSGARFWRLTTPSGPLCLRRWPKEHPPRDRLQFIQAVLWHVRQEGFPLVPVPCETRATSGYVEHDGHFWELAPWLPGKADFQANPSASRLRAALEALAGFHQAAATFPLPQTNLPASPGMLARRQQLLRYSTGGAAKISAAMASGDWPEFVERGPRILSLFGAAQPRVRAMVEAAARAPIALQPAIRDIWHDHVLFDGDQVSGLVDFGALCPETVAGDVARLLGSLAGDDLAAWQNGLAAYQTRRKLSDAELLLIAAFDRTNVLMSGVQWLEWIFVDGRTFENRAGVLARIDENLLRLQHLVAC